MPRTPRRSAYHPYVKAPRNRSLRVHIPVGVPRDYPEQRPGQQYVEMTLVVPKLAWSCIPAHQLDASVEREASLSSFLDEVLGPMVECAATRLAGAVLWTRFCETVHEAPDVFEDLYEHNDEADWFDVLHSFLDSRDAESLREVYCWDATLHLCWPAAGQEERVLEALARAWREIALLEPARARTLWRELEARADCVADDLRHYINSPEFERAVAEEEEERQEGEDDASFSAEA